MNLDPKPIVDEEPDDAAPATEPTRTGIPTTPEFVDTIVAATPGHIDAQTVLSTIAAINAANEGAEVGTRMLGPEGQTASRVRKQGVAMWAVVTLDGDLYYDTQPTLPWQKIS